MLGKFSINILIIFQLIMSPSAVAGVYKWVDEDGNVIYSDKPVSGKDADQVTIRKAPEQDRHSKERYKKRQRLLDVLQEERNEKITAAREKRKKLAEQEQKCSALRKKLAKLKQASALYEKTDDPNNPKILTDEERKAAEEKYRQYLAENCRLAGGNP